MLSCLFFLKLILFSKFTLKTNLIIVIKLNSNSVLLFGVVDKVLFIVNQLIYF